jgi:hypothetical protein
MDYSLLVVREEVATTVENLTRNMGGSRNMTCHFGIIDYLQTWSMEKKLETLFKTLLRKDKYRQLSSVPPDLYQSRFLSFIYEYVINA